MAYFSFLHIENIASKYVFYIYYCQFVDFRIVQSQLACDSMSHLVVPFDIELIENSHSLVVH